METIIGAGGIAKTGDPLLGKMRPGEPKALMPIAGKPMVQWVLDAVGATDSISNVVIIGLSPDQGLD